MGKDGNLSVFVLAMASAIGVSSDGTVVAGSSGGEAFRWDAVGGLTGLGYLTNSTNSGARAISGNGSIIVGYSQIGSVDEAFVWDVANWMRSVKDVLLDDFGVTSMSSWGETWADGISEDGCTIVGWGTNPDGNTEAWIAVIPEPAGLCIWVALIVVLSKRRRASNVQA